VKCTAGLSRATHTPIIPELLAGYHDINVLVCQQAMSHTNCHLATAAAPTVLEEQHFAAIFCEVLFEQLFQWRTCWLVDVLQQCLPGSL
jgi:hypothetical protein